MNQKEKKKETILFLIKEAKKLVYSGYYGSQTLEKLEKLETIENRIDFELELNNLDELESAVNTLFKVKKALKEIKKNKAHAIRYVKDNCISLSNYCKRKIKYYK